eukprot:gene24678-32142_t
MAWTRDNTRTSWWRMRSKWFKTTPTTGPSWERAPWRERWMRCTPWTSSKTPGSPTICIATLDKKLNQLSYSNIGDCGLMVIRHIDSETAGYMRERQLPRHLRTNDLRIAYLSQQQLRSFNLPYQLGYGGGIPNYSGSFETPADADTASIPIVREVSSWERKWFVFAAQGGDPAKDL